MEGPEVPQPSSTSSPIVEVDDALSVTSEDLAPVVVHVSPSKSFIIPWSTAKSWNSLQTLIGQLYQEHPSDGVPKYIEKGEYELKASHSRVILPQLYENVVKPGWDLYISPYSRAKSESGWEDKDEKDSQLSSKHEMDDSPSSLEYEFEDILGPSLAMVNSRSTMDVQNQKAQSASDDLGEQYSSAGDYESDTEDSYFETTSASSSNSSSSTTSSTSSDSSFTSTSQSVCRTGRAYEPSPLLIEPRDRFGNQLSCITDSETVVPCIESFSKEHEQFREPLLAIEAYLTCQDSSNETVSLVSFKGPKNEKSHHSPRIHWEHARTKALDFEAFKNLSLSAAKSDSTLVAVVSKLLHKVENAALRPSVHGQFIDPGTVMRCDHFCRSEKHSAIFACVPYLAMMKMQTLTPGNNVPSKHPMSLLQSYYPFESTRSRDNEQAFRKYGNKSPQVIHMPLIWILTFGSRYLVTCGALSQSDIMDDSITHLRLNYCETVSEPMIRITDPKNRVFIYPSADCKCFLSMEQKIREIPDVTVPSDPDSLRLFLHNGDEIIPVSVYDWPEILMTKTSSFLDISFSFNVENRKGPIRVLSRVPEMISLEIKSDSFSLAQKVEKAMSTTSSTANRRSKGLLIGELVPPFLTWKLHPPKEFSKFMNEMNEKFELELDSNDFKLDHILEVIKRVWINEVMDDERYSSEVFPSVLSASYYKSLHVESIDVLRSRIVNQNLSQPVEDPKRQSHSPFIYIQLMSWANSNLTIFAKEYFERAVDLLGYFTNDFSHELLGKCLGAIQSTLNIFEEVQSMAVEILNGPPNLAIGHPTWMIIDLHELKDVCPIVNPLHFPPRPISKCKSCRENKSYASFDSAINHLRKRHFITQDNISLDMAQFILEGWVWRTDQIETSRHVVGIVGCLLDALPLLNRMDDQIQKLSAALVSKDTFNPAIHHSTSLIPAFFVAIIFLCSVQRMTAFIHTGISKRDENSRVIAKAMSRIRKMNSIYESEFQESVSTFRKELGGLLSTAGLGNGNRGRSLGPEYLFCWIVGKMISRPLQADMGATDFYREYLSFLKFQANHHPGKRLLRDINLFHEEIEALNQINLWQLNAVANLLVVLDDKTYAQRCHQRKLLFESEMAILQQCQQSLVRTHNEHINLTAQCVPLADRARQSIEINEEDHGKAIMVFTIVTVIFLPLSFVTGYLGMNVSDIRNLQQSQQLFWKIATPLAVGSITLMLLVAYNGDYLRGLLTHVADFILCRESLADVKSISVFERRIMLESARKTAKATNTFDHGTFRSLPLVSQCILPLNSQGYGKINTSYKLNPGRPPDFLGLSDSHTHHQSNRTIKTNAHSSHPTYIKIHRKHLDIDTLRYYKIPFEIDPDDPGYFIIFQDMDTYETDLLFEHTRRNRLRQSTGFKRSDRKSDYYFIRSRSSRTHTDLNEPREDRTSHDTRNSQARRAREYSFRRRKVSSPRRVSRLLFS